MLAMNNRSKNVFIPMEDLTPPGLVEDARLVPWQPGYLPFACISGAGSEPPPTRNVKTGTGNKSIAEPGLKRSKRVT